MISQRSLEQALSTNNYSIGIDNYRQAFNNNNSKVIAFTYKEIWNWSLIVQLENNKKYEVFFDKDKCRLIVPFYFFRHPLDLDEKYHIYNSEINDLTNCPESLKIGVLLISDIANVKPIEEVNLYLDRLKISEFQLSEMTPSNVNDYILKNVVGDFNIFGFKCYKYKLPYYQNNKKDRYTFDIKHPDYKYYIKIHIENYYNKMYLRSFCISDVQKSDFSLINNDKYIRYSIGSTKELYNFLPLKYILYKLNGTTFDLTTHEILEIEMEYERLKEEYQKKQAHF